METQQTLLHSANLNVFGATDAPILVVCDNVGQHTFDTGGVMPPVLFNKFAAQAYANGLKDEDFIFVLPCPTMPDAIIGVERKENDFLKSHREEFREVISKFPNVRLGVTLGKIAAKQMLERPVQITKVRGQVLTEDAWPFPVLPLFSPKHVHVRPENEEIWKSDFRVIKTLFDNNFDPAILAESVKQAEYEWCFDLSDLILTPPKAMAVDSESRGGQWYRGADIILAQITYKEAHALLCPLDLAWWNSFQTEHGRPMTQRGRALLVNQLRRLFGEMGIPVTGHNFGSDVHKFRKLGVHFDNWKHDSMQLMFLVDENMLTKDLAETTRREVARLAGYSDEFDKKWDKEHMELVPPSEMRLYAGGDTDACFCATKSLVRKAMQDSRNYNTYQRIQMPALRMFPRMEEHGMIVDQPALRELGTVLADQEHEWYNDLIAQVPPAVRRRHADKGLSFSRAEFTIDCLFSPKSEGGRGLTPLVFTKSTKKEEREEDRVPSTSTKDHLPYFETEDEFVAQLIKYQKLQKMRSTYVGQEGGVLIPQRRANAPEKFTPAKGFWQYLSDDSRIHPSFFLHRTVTGRTACLVGKTPITVLDERGSVPIRDIRIGDWIWAYDDDLRPVPAQVSWQGMTIKRAKLVKVSYLTQGGRKVKSIKCTPEHLFRLRNGGYVQAQHLMRGHRVLSLERSINHAGYRQVYATGQRVQLEHRMIVAGAEDADAIHHIDEVKTNNTPTNIVPLDADEHAGIHGWTPERILARTKTLQRSISTYEALKGKDHPHYYTVNKEWCLGVLRAHGGKPSAFRDVYGLDYTCIMQKLADLGVDWKAEREQFNRRGERITEDLVAQARLAPRLYDASRILGVNFYKTKELLATDHNHIITAVEEIEEVSAVYDITVPRFHNFIANGVCVHNSAYPNAQNFPKRGKIAKAFRKIFKCAPGWGFVEADLSQAELRIAAWMAGEPTMLRIYNQAGGDIHVATACIILGISPDEMKAWKGNMSPIYREFRNQMEGVTEDTMDAFFELMRYRAKAVNFGLIYGMGWKKLIVYAKTTYGVTFSESQAQDIRRKYFALYARLAAWHDSMREFVRTHGYVRSLHGAVRHLPNIFSPDEYVQGECERQAINSPVQRFGSDLGLMGMIRFGRDCDWRVMHPMAFIHDAVIIHCRQDFIPEVAGAMKFYLESNPLEAWFGIRAPLPILADVKTTETNLGEMEDFHTEAYCPEWYQENLDAA